MTGMLYRRSFPWIFSHPYEQFHDGKNVKNLMDEEYKLRVISSKFTRFNYED